MGAIRWLLKWRKMLSQSVEAMQVVKHFNTSVVSITIYFIKRPSTIFL
jgi:hypothetical protein